MTVSISFDPATDTIRRYDSSRETLVQRPGVKPAPFQTHSAHLVPGATSYAGLIRFFLQTPPEEHAR